MLKKLFFALIFVAINSINPAKSLDVPSEFVKTEALANAVCGGVCFKTGTHPTYRNQWAEGICKCGKVVEIRVEKTATSAWAVREKLCTLECQKGGMEYINQSPAGTTLATLCRCMDYR